MESAFAAAPDGQFIAGGTYEYHLNDAPAGVREPWTVHMRPDGVRITRAQRLAPAYGAGITVEALERRTEAGLSHWNILVDWRNDTPGAVPRAKASYIITSDSVFCERVINNDAAQFIDHERPAHLQVAPLMRCFYGEAIQRTATIGGGEPLPAFVPWIHDPRDAANLLLPQFDPRWARLIDVTMLETDLGEIESMRYQFVGGNYTEACEFWVDEHGVLLRYRMPQRADMVWDVRLAGYTRG